MGGERYVRPAGLAAKLDGGPSRIAFTAGNETDVKIERSEACKMWRPGHAVRQPEQARGDVQAVGRRSLEREIDAARGRFAQVLDPAFAVERDRVSRGKVELFDVEGAIDEREPCAELAGGNVGEQKFTYPQGHTHIVVAELTEQVLVVGGGSLRRGHACRHPGAPDRSVADHVPQVEPVAVERKLDQAPRAALKAQIPAE